MLENISKEIFYYSFIPVFVITILILILTIVEIVATPKPGAKEKMHMESRFKLFLMFLPFALLAFVFCYLPLWGWRYSFFDYQTDITVIPLREYNEPIAEFKYKHAFITELGELKFDYKQTSQLACSFKFAFAQQYFRLLPVNPSKPKER